MSVRIRQWRLFWSIYRHNSDLPLFGRLQRAHSKAVLYGDHAQKQIQEFTVMSTASQPPLDTFYSYLANTSSNLTYLLTKVKTLTASSYNTIK